jgi:hypothetical protein
MADLLQRQIAGVPVSTVLIILVALVVLFKIVRVILGRRAPSLIASVQVQVHCTACGWSGALSKYNLRCSKCNRPVTPPPS